LGDKNAVLLFLSLLRHRWPTSHFSLSNRENASRAPPTSTRPTVAPFFETHEGRIDAGINSAQTETVAFLQRQINALWKPFLGLTIKTSAAAKYPDSRTAAPSQQAHGLLNAFSSHPSATRPQACVHASCRFRPWFTTWTSTHPLLLGRGWSIEQYSGSMEHGILICEWTPQPYISNPSYFSFEFESANVISSCISSP